MLEQAAELENSLPGIPVPDGFPKPRTDSQTDIYFFSLSITLIHKKSLNIGKFPVLWSFADILVSVRYSELPFVFRNAAKL
jgi:hypothetical protein